MHNAMQNVQNSQPEKCTYGNTSCQQFWSQWVTSTEHLTQQDILDTIFIT